MPAERSEPLDDENAQTARAMSVSSASSSVTSDFEAPFSERAPGWLVNAWGSPWPYYQTARETSPTNVHSGVAAQRFTVINRPSNGDAHLIRPFGFVNGKTYRATLYLKASASTAVTVQMRRDAHPWETFATKTFNVGTSWQKVEIQGTYKWSNGGSLRLAVKELGVHLYVDDVTIEDVSASASAPVSGGVTLPAAGGSATQVIPVASSGLEGTYTGTAPGWKVNYWGTVPGRWDAKRETRAEYVRSGTSSQMFHFVDPGTGGAHFTYPYAFARGKTYRATVYLRSDHSTPVQVFMRRDAHPWDPFASKTVTVTTSWQKVEITGTSVSDVGGTLRIAPQEPGTKVWIDDMSMAEVETNDMAPFSTATIPAHMFGMHVNKFGTHQRWPGLNNGIFRLWNTGTYWRDLEPTNNAWNFTSGAGRRLDMLVDYVKKNDPSVEILMTLGQTPQWASKPTSVQGLVAPGANSAPANMEDWRDYVRTLARRYAGRIRYWELWNEPDFPQLYNGSIADMVTMARIAREELKAADPANKLVSPGLTTGQGMPWLNNFLAAGGGQYVDVIGFHWYFSTSPEKLALSISNVRQMMANYGLEAKELWNTEGAPGCDALVYRCDSYTPTAEQIRSTTARAMMIMWAKGVSNFNYYFWERTEPLAKLVESDFVTATQAGFAYKEMVSWMKGARLVDSYRVNDSVYVFRMNRGTDNYVILWSTSGNTVVNLPSTWAVSKVRTLLGSESMIPSSRQITIGLEPVMLKQ
ncbi:MAG TPA: carbohydrate binding domain-containing protein [Burkholderiaceae bacterium]|nr:carbohydrate binding domain-containing protein [Burkholderiaceae bacterium]